jgi:drug/metabolite transporter (DMT)-like permease
VLALSSQVLGWLLITISLPRLPAVATSLLLGVQPVAAVVFAAILLEEDPSPLQLVGAGAILAGLIVASVGRSTRMAESVPSQA